MSHNMQSVSFWPRDYITNPEIDIMWAAIVNNLQLSYVKLQQNIVTGCKDLCMFWSCVPLLPPSPLQPTTHLENVMAANMELHI